MLPVHNGLIFSQSITRYTKTLHTSIPRNRRRRLQNQYYISKSIFLFLTIFWICVSFNWNVYTKWKKDKVNTKTYKAIKFLCISKNHTLLKWSEKVTQLIVLRVIFNPSRRLGRYSLPFSVAGEEYMDRKYFHLFLIDELRRFSDNLSSVLAWYSEWFASEF